MTKAQDLRIYYAKNENLWVIEDCDDLGQYKTKERALEVLDEIQSLLQPEIIYHQEKPVETIQEGYYQLSQKVNMELQELSTYVYQMPKE